MNSKKVYWPRTETTICYIVWERNDVLLPWYSNYTKIIGLRNIETTMSAESIASSDVYPPPLKKHKVLEKDEALRLRKEYIA